MKNILHGLIIVIFVSGSHLSFAQTLRPSSSGSAIQFTIKNLGVNTTGDFKKIDGQINFYPENPSLSTFNVTIETSTIDTDNGTRDKHLKKEEYLNITKYPSMKFVASKVSALKTGTYKMDGNLTIKNVTKPVTFNFTATEQAGGYLFKGAFIINRRDYGVGGRSLTMADNLTVKLSVFATK